MKLTIAVLAIAIAFVSGEVRSKRGVLAAPYVAPYVAPYASYAAYYSAPSYYSPYVAAPNPIIARASRIVGAPGFAPKYYSPYVAPAAPYTVLV